MTPVQELTQSVHAHVLDEARRTNVAVDETHFAWAASPQASVGVAALPLSAAEQSDLARGRNLMFVTITLPPGVDKTTDGVPITDGAYLVNLTVDATLTSASARLMTTAGREVGMLPVVMTPDHHHEDRMALSGHISWCYLTVDIAVSSEDGSISAAAAITFRWC